MKPFDDTLPEEREPQQQEFLPLLQQLYPQPAPITPDEQARAIARVRARLLQAETDAWEMPGEDTQVTVVDLPLQGAVPFRAKPRREHIVRLLNTLAAVIVVGAIITASVLLFANHSPEQSGGNPVTASPVVVHTQANQLDASISVTPGPYFLGELIEVDSSLTNRSHTTYIMQGVPAANPCNQSLGVDTTGGGAPHVPAPPMGFVSCPVSWSQLKPGQAITIHQYIVLSATGTIALTEGARFLMMKTVDTQGSKAITNAPDPLQGHWPSLTIKVNPHVPPDRMLSFQLQGTQVIVNGPTRALSHLLYLYTINCQDFHDQGSTYTGNFIWERQSTNTVGLPGCPGKNPHWNFAFAAVGYAMVMGHYRA